MRETDSPAFCLSSCFGNHTNAAGSRRYDYIRDGRVYDWVKEETAGGSGGAAGFSLLNTCKSKNRDHSNC